MLWWTLSRWHLTANVHSLQNGCKPVVNLMQRLLQHNTQKRVQDKRDTCELVSEAPCDWKNAEGTEGSLVNKAFTAQWSPPDLCRGSMGLNRQALTCQEHCQWQLIYITPEQSQARGTQHVIHTCISHWPLTGSRAPWALRNLNLCTPSKKNRARVKVYTEFQGEELSAVATIYAVRSSVCRSSLPNHLVVNIMKPVSFWSTTELRIYM